MTDPELRELPDSESDDSEGEEDEGSDDEVCARCETRRFYHHRTSVGCRNLSLSSRWATMTFSGTEISRKTGQRNEVVPRGLGMATVEDGSNSAACLLLPA